MIGHRSGDFKKLYASIQPRLQTIFGTKQPVFLSTSSAWGVMEGAIRNTVVKKVLNCMCGRVLGQMARRQQTLRQGRRGTPGGMGPADPAGTARSKTRDR